MEIKITEERCGDIILLKMFIDNDTSAYRTYFVSNEFDYKDKPNAMLFMCNRAAEYLFDYAANEIESEKLKKEIFL